MKNYWNWSLVYIKWGDFAGISSIITYLCPITNFNINLL